MRRCVICHKGWRTHRWYTKRRLCPRCYKLRHYYGTASLFERRSK